MNKRISYIVISLLLVWGLALSGQAAAAQDQAEKDSYGVLRQLAQRSAEEAWTKMGERPAELIVLTNAGYSVVGRYTTEACLDGLAVATGCSAGRGNLLEVHTSREKPLRFLFYDKQSGRSVFSQLSGDAVLELITAPGADLAAMPVEKLYTRLALENIAQEKLLADPAAWNKKVEEKVFGGFEFGIVTLANVAAGGAPYDFVRAALFHDHLCPGVTSGYQLAGYLKKEFPLRSPEESYYVLAMPPWCKDDGLAVLLNTTPGKNGMAVIPLDAKTKESLKPEAQKLAGVYFRYDSKTKKGEGLILAYDFDRAAALNGIDMNKGFPWETRLKSDLWYMDYLDRPELFISVIKRFALSDGEEPSDYAKAGVNPLERLDFLKK